MDGFTIIDGGVAIFIVLSGLLAYSRGFLREALAIAGWIVAGIVGFVFAPAVEPLITEIPVVGDFIADSCELSMIGAFAVVFAVALIIASVITPLFSSIVQRSALGGVDQGLGFVFGVARGVLLIAIAYFVYDTVMSAQSIDMIDNSRSARIFAQVSDSVAQQEPEQALGWITARYEQLVGNCEAP
jgi:membrane protein required for colicin V production